MKKFLLLLMAAMLLPMAMNAQLLSNQDMKMHRAPYALKSLNHRMMAPARVNLGENQMVLGHYDTDDLADANGGLGITGLPGVIPIGTVITPAELAAFQGGRIVKFRVGLATSTAISRVFVIPVTNGVYGTTTEWSCSVRAAGWNEITLETPYEIDLADNTGLMIGFDYQQTSSNYPISAVEVGDIYPSYIYYQGSWQDVGLSAYGNLSVQCIVESENFPDYIISASSLVARSYTKLGDELQFSFMTRNSGVATEAIAAGACSYNVLVDGELVTTITNPEAFGRDFVQFYNAIPTAGMTPGKHTLTIQAATLNGEPVEQSTSTSRDFILYENGFPRQMHVIEQFTSTYCTYCPLGINMLKILTSSRDDIAWIGIHGNMSGTDPMRTLQCDSIMSYEGADSYPSGSFDRSTGWDSDETIITGLGYYEEYHNQIAQEISAFLDYIAEAPSFATVNINSTIDADTREAVITVNGELTPDFDMMMGADSKLTVYIIEDGVIARQLNMGTWVNNFEHNGVFRKALNSIKGNDLNRDGNTYENVFNITIPSSWKLDNLNVVAFISRPLANGAAGVYTDLYINQANKRKLGEYDEPTILRGDVNDDGKVNIEDVTTLINYLLYGESIPEAGDCDLDGNPNITDVTTLIDFLINGVWPE